jgi:hypothetical protein
MKTARLRAKFDPDVIPSPLDPNFYCDSCSHRFKRKGPHREHLRSKHKMADLPPISKFNDTGITPDPHGADFNCISCKRRGLSRAHLRSKHKMADLPRFPKKDPDINELPCHICQCTYANRGNLKIHNQKFHSNSP